MAASPKPRTSKSEDLVLYRLGQVEDAVKEVGAKVDRQENIKKSDLTEFKDSIITRFTEVRDDLQRQIDEKADANDVRDVKRLIGGVGAALTSIIVALVIYYLTTGAQR